MLKIYECIFSSNHLASLKNKVIKNNYAIYQYFVKKNPQIFCQSGKKLYFCITIMLTATFVPVAVPSKSAPLIMSKPSRELFFIPIFIPNG